MNLRSQGRTVFEVRTADTTPCACGWLGTENETASRYGTRPVAVRCDAPSYRPLKRSGNLESSVHLFSLALGPFSTQPAQTGSVQEGVQDMQRGADNRLQRDASRSLLMIRNLTWLTRRRIRHAGGGIPGLSCTDRKSPAEPTDGVAAGSLHALFTRYGQIEAVAIMHRSTVEGFDFFERYTISAVISRL
ncbi:hypothetical protein P152DRAFT_208070 [Eremomyces bilateralis CBS 781.70]|uniref:RRM domain-containing protein n=1 Tax=Eremomyces bilateralis CBS 781.70 TaxID=1392243 RepID=A0A6G1FSU4_9PEZI|nr:uncharacterized protein P152DRAFT_208070 [Eremomyces bilateralis CBS 781.70]KAF1808749.1 hypothetical protein P152DRAFT_208070 [Eremomyces bilateralis CBS 781.70]